MFASTKSHNTMAHYTITCKCGHEHTYQLFGKMKERERKLAWLETQVCPECEAKNRAKSREDKTSKAQAEAEEKGLPTLVGSEKQVAWAMSIRYDFLRALDRLEPLATTAEARQMMDKWSGLIKAQTSARWFIDNRDNLTTDNKRAILNSFIQIFEK